MSCVCWKPRGLGGQNAAVVRGGCGVGAVQGETASARGAVGAGPGPLPLPAAEQPEVLVAVRPAVDLPRPHHRQRVRQLPRLGVAQVPPQRRRRGLVVAAGLLHEGVDVELLRHGRAAPGELHEDAGHHPRVLGDQQRRPVAAQLGRPEPPQEAVLDGLGHEGQHRGRAQGQQVGEGEPHAVVALEVPQLVRQDGLHLGRREQLQQ
mmetsp:Transcript_9286/g.26032  ORF Transcript_9286/g.26032 Transcript_9286/m.26032 type:complete len:206 (+) Transcript_9286:46-663(+)